MSKRPDRSLPSPLAMELFQPDPRHLYGLDTAAHLAGVPRRSLLIYCRAGLVRPVLQPPYGVMGFTREAILLARRICQLQSIHQIELPWVKTMFELFEEVERLRLELRALRRRQPRADGAGENPGG